MRPNRFSVLQFFPFPALMWQPLIGTKLQFLGRDSDCKQGNKKRRQGRRSSKFRSWTRRKQQQSHIYKQVRVAEDSTHPHHVSHRLSSSQQAKGPMRRESSALKDGVQVSAKSKSQLLAP